MISTWGGDNQTADVHMLGAGGVKPKTLECSTITWNENIAGEFEMTWLVLVWWSMQIHSGKWEKKIIKERKKKVYKNHIEKRVHDAAAGEK